MRILSMRRMSSFSYWVYAGRRLFHTEYTQDVVFFILSIRRTSSFSYWVYAENHLFHTEYRLDLTEIVISLVTTIILNYTEYTQDVNFFILSMRRTSSFSYWVCAGCCLIHTEYAQKSPLNYTEYELEANFAFGQTKQPLTHLKRIFIKKYLKEDVMGPRWTFSKKICFPNSKI